MLLWPYIVFSGPFKLKSLIQSYFYCTKQEESSKSKLVSFPMVKLFTSEFQSQVKKWWQSIILISLINERSRLLFSIILPFYSKKNSPSSLINFIGFSTLLVYFVYLVSLEINSTVLVYSLLHGY